MTTPDPTTRPAPDAGVVEAIARADFLFWRRNPDAWDDELDAVKRERWRDSARRWVAAITDADGAVLDAEQVRALRSLIWWERQHEPGEAIEADLARLAAALPGGEGAT